MAVKKLRLCNFRNHLNLELAPSAGISVFTGWNGVGKTSILEAVHVAGTGKSFRIGKTADLITAGFEEARVAVDVDHQGLTNHIDVEIVPGGKRVYVDGKLQRKIGYQVGGMGSVVFSPGDHRIIEGDANDRRQFLNRAVAVVEPAYADLLQRYNKVLLQRNKTLQTAFRDGWGLARAEQMLEAWDEQIADLGSALVLMRTHYIDALSQIAPIEYERISHRPEKFLTTYQPFGEDLPTISPQATVDEIRSFHRNLLRDSIRRDLAVGTTSAGPHKDEILLTLGGNKVKFYGSQGEKRTCALALRLAEVSIFRSRLKRIPILLIDDVSSELDEVRRKSLVELLREEEAQVFLTATELPNDLMRDAGRAFAHWELNNAKRAADGHHGKDQLHSR